jgi:hypothetical protein
MYIYNVVAMKITFLPFMERRIHAFIVGEINETGTGFSNVFISRSHWFGCFSHITLQKQTNSKTIRSKVLVQNVKSLHEVST